MDNSFDSLIANIKNIVPSSCCPLILFDKERKIIYSNEAFQKKFSLNEDSFTGIIPDFLIIVDNYNSVTFSQIPIEKMLNKQNVFYYKDQNENDLIFKGLIFQTETKDNKIIYRALFIEVTDLNETLMVKTIRALIKASQLKDNDTGNHIQRINEYSEVLSQHLFETRIDFFPEITIDFIKKIGRVASMHDVGKIGIPDFILIKPAKLTDEEYKVMQEHTINGAFILSEIAGQMARDIALFHHEKWDGSGYPYALKEDSIPLSARIVTIADVYDALRMKRSYKNSIPHDKVVEMIIENKGKQFDPILIDAFCEINLKFDQIYEKMSDDIEVLDGV